MVKRHFIVSAVALLVVLVPSSYAASWFSWGGASGAPKEKELERAIREGRSDDVALMVTSLTEQDFRDAGRWDTLNDQQKTYVRDYAPHLNIDKVGEEKFANWQHTAEAHHHRDNNISRLLGTIIENYKKRRSGEETGSGQGAGLIDLISGRAGFDLRAPVQQLFAGGKAAKESLTGATEHDDAVDAIIHQLGQLATFKDYIGRCIRNEENLEDCQSYLNRVVESFLDDSVYWGSFEEYEHMLKAAVAKMKLNFEAASHSLLGDQRVLGRSGDNKAIAKAAKALPSEESEYNRQLSYLFRSPILVAAYKRYLGGKELWERSYGAPAKIKQAINDVKAFIQALKTDAADIPSLRDLLPSIEVPSNKYDASTLAFALSVLGQFLKVTNGFLKSEYGESQSQTSGNVLEEEWDFPSYGDAVRGPEGGPLTSEELQRELEDYNVVGRTVEGELATQGEGDPEPVPEIDEEGNLIVGSEQFPEIDEEGELID